MEGSSSIIRLGLDIRARPMASICCSPPERVPAVCFRRSFSRGKRWNTCSLLSSTEALGAVNAPISRFSSTVILVKMRRPSGTWAMPSSTILWGAVPLIFLSMKSTSPPLGFKRPETVFRMVDFPAPFAPIRVTISPCFTSKLTPLTAWIGP